MDACTLNNTTYQVGITLFRRNAGAQEIPIDHILKLTIINDSFEPFPRAKIIIKDPSSTVLPLYAADNNSVVGIKLQSQERYGDDVRTVTKVHAFNINRVKPLNFSGSDNTYEIDAVSEYITPWMNPINFSTGNSNVSVTDTACNMLARAKIPFTRPLKESAHKESFISDVNSPLRDHVNRLLDLASISGSGFYFPWYNIVKNKLAIESITNIVSNGVLQPYNVFAVASDGYGAEEYYTPTSIEYTNDVSATRINTISRGVKELNFSHIKGKFNERRMLYTDIAKGSTYNGLKPIIDNTTNNEEDINYTQFGSSHEWFSDIRKAVRTYNGVQIKIKGSPERNIGDLIIMKSQGSLKNTFDGLWMNMRTIEEYSFGSNKYDQTIIMSRVGKI